MDFNYTSFDQYLAAELGRFKMALDNRPDRMPVKMERGEVKSSTTGFSSQLAATSYEMNTNDVQRSDPGPPAQLCSQISMVTLVISGTTVCSDLPVSIEPDPLDGTYVLTLGSSSALFCQWINSGGSIPGYVIAVDYSEGTGWSISIQWTNGVNTYPAYSTSGSPISGTFPNLVTGPCNMATAAYGGNATIS